MPEKGLPRTVSRPVFNTYALTVCALLTALSVVLARVLTLIPAETTRISLEAVPIVLSGLLFGPIPGAVVGFARRSHRLPVLPLRLQSHFLRAPHPVRPAGRCGTAVCNGPAQPCSARRWPSSPRPSWAPSCGRAWRWLWCTAAMPSRHFSGKAGVRSIQFCPHRHGGHADRVAAAAPPAHSTLCSGAIQVKGGAEHDHQ